MKANTVLKRSCNRCLDVLSRIEVAARIASAVVLVRRIAATHTVWANLDAMERGLPPGEAPPQTARKTLLALLGMAETA